MPGPYDSKNARVRFSSTSSGTYTNGALFTSYEHTEGSENGSTTRYFGGQAERPGDPTMTGTLNALFEKPDATGQDLLRTAKRAGTTLWMQLCPLGTATGAKVTQGEIEVTEYREAADANADNVTVTFSYKMYASTVTEVTLA